MLTLTFVSYHIIFISILLLTISNSASSNRSTIAKDTQLLRPTLRLVRYKLHDSTKWVQIHTDLEKGSSFDEDFISKNGSDYTISEDVSRVLIRCIAKYPIEIVFPFVEHVDSAVYLRMTAERLSEFNEDLDEPMTQSYLLYIYINFLNAKFFSSTLACQSVENKEISSSVHVYKLSLNEIERKGQTIQIAFDSKQNPLQVELPCRPASPTASIVLQKQGEVSIWENGNFSSVPVWNEYKWTKFDPKIGITLTLPESQIYYNSNLDELIGLYKCTLSEGSEDDYVLFNVSRKSGAQDKNVFYPKFKLKGKASFGLLVEKNDSKSFYEKYMCCSGVPSKPPAFIVQNCDSLLECDVEKTRLPIETIENALAQSRSRAGHFNHSSNSNCTTGTVYGVSSILLCKGENIEVSQQFYQTLRMSNENNGSRSWIEKSFYIPRVPYSIEWKTKLERKIVISIGRSFKGNHIGHDTGHWENFWSRHNVYNKRSRSFSKQEIIQFNAEIYEGESIFCMCFGLYLFHAEGGYIRIIWKNGTKTVLQDSDIQSNDVEFSNAYFSDWLTVNAIFVKPIEASTEMISVECFQPVWNESSWERTEMPLEIIASSKPVFSGPSEEIVYFYLNEKECEITCQLLQGIPVPKTIEVMKDEKSLVVLDKEKNLSNATDSILINTREGIVTIKFPTVSYEIHGVYQCIANNIKGKTVKTIKVIVIEKTSAFVIASLVCIGLMTGILCLGLGLRLWAQKRGF